MKFAQIAGPFAALLVLTAAARAAASPVPADTVVQNVNGVQQCVMTYNVPPGFDSGALSEEPFELDGYEYTFASANRVENYHEDKKSQTETVTVNTAQQELSAVLAKLPSTKEYSDGKYSGTLTLNTSTIRTEAAGYETSSYPVSATREFDGLDSNDPSYLPSTTSKDGVTLTLQSVDWQVEASDLVEDMLVPSSYRAVATYSGTGYRKTPTGYVSTASYTGTVSCRVLQDITYTVTYLGTAMPEPVTQSEPLASSDTQDSAAEPDAAPGDDMADSSGVIAETGAGLPVTGSGTNEETPGSSDKATAELLADKTGGEDLNQQGETEPEEESLSQILYIILGIITVILIIALLAWLYIRWQKRRAAVLGDEYQVGGAGYPPDTYMDSSDGQYPGVYPDERAYDYPQNGNDTAGNPYAMADPYTVEDPYPDGGVSPEGIPYYGQGPYAGQEFYPPDAGAQDDDRADRSEYPDESGFPEESSFPVDADGQDGASPESGEGQENEVHQPRFLPETGYIPEE